MKFRFQMLRSLPFVLIFMTLASGCLSPKKVDKWVKNQYGETAAQPVKRKSDYLRIVSSVPGMGDHLSEGSKKTHNVLPLLFYWRFDYDNTCTLNPQIPVNNFINTVGPYANKSLKKKLNGGSIELSVVKIPNRFVIADRAQVVWLVYGFGWDKISIKPLDDQLTVSYKVLNADSSPGKSGSVSVLNIDKGFGVGQFQSVKRRTQEYLVDYNQSITSMSRMVIDRIVDEL